MSKDNVRFLIVGVGNIYRGDDALGILAARFLRRYFGDKVKIINFDISFEELLNLWDGIDFVILIDSLVSEAGEAGEIYRIQVGEGLSIPNVKFYSTHSIGVAEYIEISKSLSKIPREIIIYGVIGEDFDIGASISSKVRLACKCLVSKILEEVSYRVSSF